MNNKKIYDEKLKEYRDISSKIAELEIRRSSNLDEIKALEEEREIVGKEIVRIKNELSGTDTMFGQYGDEVKSLKAELDLLYKKREGIDYYDGISKVSNFFDQHLVKTMIFSFGLGVSGVAGVAKMPNVNLTVFVISLFVGTVIAVSPFLIDTFVYEFLFYTSLGKKVNEFLKKKKIRKVNKKISKYERKFLKATSKLNETIKDNGNLYSERKRLLGDKNNSEDRVTSVSDKIKELSKENMDIDKSIEEFLAKKKCLFIELASMEIDLMNADELDEVVILDDVQNFEEKGNVKKIGSKGF